MSDWEDWADEEKEIEENDVNEKFADEEVVDKDKEERERQERLAEKKAHQEEIKKAQEEKKKDEKDYEKLFNERLGIDDKDKKGVMTKEEIKKENPTWTDAQINDYMSRQAEEVIGSDLFANDKSKDEPALGKNIKELKGEKAYKEFGKEVADYIISNGQSNNHIPRFFSELFNGLSDKITITKLRTIINDFDTKLKKKKEEEERKKNEDSKADKKQKGKKKAKVGGVGKAMDLAQNLIDDVFDEEEYPEGEYADYGDEGDAYDPYARDQIDFM